MLVKELLELLSFYYPILVRDFAKRFASIPDILELDHLTVSGNVNFGKGVVLKGTVIIIANHGDQVIYFVSCYFYSWNS